jgi:hypothetical protein
VLSVLGAPLTPSETPSGEFDRAAATAALEARELRLLAYATGDHLPIELALEVAALRARRTQLAG